MIERNYSAYISDHADAVARAGLLDTVEPLPGERGADQDLICRWRPELAATYWMIVHRDLRRAPCVRAVID